MTKKIVVAFLFAVLALQAGSTGATAEQAQPQQPPIFEWSMPSSFGSVHDNRGRLVEAQPGAVSPGPWRVDLEILGRACAEGAAYGWEIGGRRASPKPLDGRCAFRYQFPAEGSYSVRLTAMVDGKPISQTQTVTVQDWLIVSIGDSVASGEAVPDVPAFRRAIWQSVRCHRSARSGTAVAAKQIEDDDPHSSVTFVHLACSGATVPAGLLGPYEGAEPQLGKPALPAQVSVLRQIAKRRQVDAVLLSIGANDIHFGDVVRFCAIPASNCFERPLPRSFGGDGERTAEEVVAKSLLDLPARYRALARQISPGIPASRVYIVPYFDPTHGADGSTCDRILNSITKPELELAQSRMLTPLNEAVKKAAAENRWNEVEEVPQRFRRHGYCAHGQAWVTTLRRSVEGLGGALKGRLLGTLHPNQQGHEATSGLISAALESDLYPGRDFPVRVLPRPPEGEDDSGLSGVADVALRIAALLAAAVLLGLTGIGAALGLLWLLVEGLLWLGKETAWPLLLGFLAGLTIVVLPNRIVAAAAKPFLSLAKTFRPLLLPLLAVIAVGTVSFSPLIQILVCILLVVLAWRLIIVPEAAKSGVTLAFELDLLRKTALHSAIALALGAVAVFAVRRVGVDSPYFESIGDLASGLLLVALVIWLAAVVLRLFSYATTRLRTVVAFVIGLALLVLGMGIGVLPGDPSISDAWPSMCAVFAGCALVLLVIDAALSVVASTRQTGELEETEAPAVAVAVAGGEAAAVADAPPTTATRPITSHAAGIGFSAAAVAAVVLAVSTGYGLVATADSDHPLNPPADESAEAIAPPRSAVANVDSMALAKKYGPVLVFTNDERWAPVRVDSYIENATLSGPSMKPDKDVTLGNLPNDCPKESETNCYTLSIECDNGDMPCADGFDIDHRPYREGAVYVRILEKDRAPAATFPDRGPYRDRLAMLIQYWYFYYYDEWKAPVFAGLLTQRHEGDWEAVTIGLDNTKRPLFVADSAHCEGSWRPWQEIEASTELPGPAIHPLIAVAEGSHANYPEAAGKRSPDSGFCGGKLPAGVGTAISYASNIRDKTEYGWLWYPPSDGWLEARADTAPMNFPGTWGADDRTMLRNFQSTEIDKGDGPQTPTLQALWREPVQLIFCGKYTPRDCPPDPA